MHILLVCQCTVVQVILQTTFVPGTWLPELTRFRYWLVQKKGSPPSLSGWLKPLSKEAGVERWFEAIVNATPITALCLCCRWESILRLGGFPFGLHPVSETQKFYQKWSSPRSWDTKGNSQWLLLLAEIWFNITVHRPLQHHTQLNRKLSFRQARNKK